MRHLFLTAAILSSASLAFADASLSIDASATGIKPSPALYGIFFEEINRAGEGGIYAEKILNRSFEDDDKHAGWDLVSGENAHGNIRIDKTLPMNPNSPNALKIEATPDSKGRIGVANDSFRGRDGKYKGLALKAGDPYLCSLYVRNDGKFTGPISVNLETADGKDLKVLARQSITNLTPAWTKKDLKLTPTEDSTTARLVISIAQPGVIYIDSVSLFPEKTWKNRPNGMRPDLMNFLDAMKPSFVRFPGGCWVEGDLMVDAYCWKETIGDPTMRRNQNNLWQYKVTNGLGYHEYLQMCEDLGADAMFVGNVGMAHRDATPMSHLQEKIDDALDAVEYALGDATTTWGAVRAANGHPKSFNLKYFEIGNENGGNLYAERYPKFYEALKKKYPNLQLIANGPVANARVDILDEHYYSSPEFFITQANRYDKYDRNGPKIYVGEYAVTTGRQGNGNLRAALGEAAFMTGMERNSDIVIMASYAPLFSHVHYKVWNPDAIYFDNARSCATPSFYVQQMFSANRPETVLPVALQSATIKTPTRGLIGLGTWHTRAEFKDIKLTTDGKPTDLPTSSLDQWKKVNGDWEAADGVIRVNSEIDNAFLTFNAPEVSSFTLSFKARKLAGAEGFLIPFHFKAVDNTSLLNLGGWGNKQNGLEFRGGAATDPTRTNASINENQWYDIKIEVNNDKYTCTLDNEKIFEGEYTGKQSLYAVAGKTKTDLILKVVNVSDDAQPTTLNLKGATLKPTGTAIELTSSSPDAENTLDKPTTVIPTPKPLTKVSPAMTYTFPPNSVTILRLPTQ